MTFEEILDQAIAMLQRRGRLTYGALKRQFQLDDAYLDDLKAELIEGQRLARDEDGRVLVWIGGAATPPSSSVPTALQALQPTAQDATLPQSVPPRAAPSILEAERRQLTVLFCDLVDSTVLAGQLDAEDLREVIRAYQAACATVIERVGGHIAQYLGDGLLVYFGYPQAHEDDAQRAVRAGLGMVAAMEALNAQFARRYRVRIAVRIGIHTGLVVVGEVGGGSRREQLALGDTPNLAARLQGLAAPDTVILSAATFHLVQGYFTSQDMGPHHLKGVAAPVHVYRILRESGAQSRLEPLVQSRLTPLVGREEEVLLVQQRWAQAKAGFGQVVLLSGEAGIGKSRLVQVLKDAVAHEPHTRIEWRGSSYHQQSALYPVIAHLHRLLPGQKDETPQEKLRTLETLLASSGLVLHEVVPLLAALLSLPLPARYPSLTLTPQRQRQKTLETLHTWLFAEARQQPVLLIVEDLHWIDPSTLELVSLLIDQSATARLCLVLTCRPEFRPSWAEAAHLTALTLPRLASAHVERLATHVAGDKTLPPALLQEVVRKTDGVPLFVEELTKVVLELGLLQEGEDGYDLSGPLPPLAIPTTLHDALMARLDRLLTVKPVAQLGAVIGRTFAYELVQTVAPLDATTLQGALAQLVEAELVTQRGVLPEATYTFKHALIQDAAYQSLLRSTRQQYHQRIAQVLEQQFPESIETQPELLAHHYTEAGIAEQALHYWQLAGERAHQRAAPVESSAHTRKALEALARLPETPEHTRHELLMLHTLRSTLSMVKGLGSPELTPIMRRMRALCQRVEDPVVVHRALSGLSAQYRVRAELHTARELAEHCLTIAQRLQDPQSIMWDHVHLGNALLQLGEFSRALEHLEQGLALYNPQQSRPQVTLVQTDPGVMSLTGAAQVLWYLGYPDQALQRSYTALALAQEVAHSFSLAYALSQVATMHRWRREPQEAHEQSAAARALATEQGFAPLVVQETLSRAWELVEQGHGEEGIAQIHQGLAALQAMQEEIRRLNWLGSLAEAYGQVGQLAEGLHALAAALAGVEQSGKRDQEAESYRQKGELLLRSGAQSPESGSSSSHVVFHILHSEEAEACFQQALTIARRQQAKSWELRAATSLTRLWRHQGKRVEAYELLAPLYSWFTEGFDTADLQDAKALLEALA